MLRRLQRLAGQLNSSLYVLLLALFKILLLRRSAGVGGGGTGDVVVGSVHANRSQQYIDTVGFFVETMVLRTNLAAKGGGAGGDASDDASGLPPGKRGAEGGGISLREAVRRVSETVHGAFEHQVLVYGRCVRGCCWAAWGG